MSLETRVARPADLPRIWELLRGLAAYERWAEFVTGSEAELGEALFGEHAAAECLVAERDSRIVGYALFYPTYSSFRSRTMLWLEDLFVEEAERGRGAGRALLAAVARLATERGHARLDWHVLGWNEPSIRFYEAVGATRSQTDLLTYSLSEGRLREIADGAPSIAPERAAPES